jgi:hypothetical protein
MKSYHNHLVTTRNYGETKNVNYSPTMRSSAIFPLVHKPKKITSIYTFMGYWLKKRNIPLVTVVITVRNTYGEKIEVRSIEIKSVKSYVFSSSDLLKSNDEEFFGSVELEIFSAVDMVFPYPAITFGLKGVNGLTFVHTCGRIYNDFDDLKSNEEQVVPETGFDLFVGESYEPFFAFVNGPIAINNKEVELEYIDSKGKKIVKNKIIKKVEPYGLGWIKLFEKNDRDFFQDEEKLCVKIRHNFKGFFPRFVAGNVYRNFEDISLTHSFYDTSANTSKHNLRNNPSTKKFFDSVLSIPFDSGFSEIELVIYPNLPYAPTNLTFELYTASGLLIDTDHQQKKIATKNSKLSYVKLIEKFSKHKNDVKNGNIRVILNGNGTVPTRMKFGLNFLNIAQNKNLPSNICFSGSVPNIKTLEKPGTFHWCSLFDAFHQKIFLHNTSFVKDGFRDADIKVQVYRTIDNKNLEWDLKIPYNGSIEVITPFKNKVKEFLNNEIGWISFSCSSPFITGYYITDYGKGVVGADHLY